MFCPNCDHEIRTTRIVEWYLKSLILNLLETGDPIRIGKLGTFLMKKGALSWRSTSAMAELFRSRKTLKASTKTENEEEDKET